ncbi:MAG: T9SS type A sorting domain-containing protein [Bacteroidia bacterium]|nr:T9SS type A sorting domain-containing protein [Bacteroidia bacterium]
MRKIAIIYLIFFFSVFAYAQIRMPCLSAGRNNPGLSGDSFAPLQATETEILKLKDSKSVLNVGDTILYDDFSDTAHWNRDNLGMGTKIWRIATTTDPEYISTQSPTQFLSAITAWNPHPVSTNKFAFFNAAQYNVSPPNPYPTTVDVTLTYANSINLSQYPGVSIHWYQNYRAFKYDKMYLEYSLDNGTSWNAYGGGELFASLATNAVGPTQMQLNLSSAIGGQSNVKIRFRFESIYNGSNPQANGSGYGWMIDEVLLSVYADNDLVLEKLLPRFSGVGYFSQLPVKQRMIIHSYKAAVYNAGGAAQHNISLNVNIHTQTDTASEFSITGISKPVMAVGERDTLLSDTSLHSFFFPPKTLVSHIIHFNIDQDETDEFALNNSDTLSFTVSDTVFARDRHLNGKVGSTLYVNAADGDGVGVVYYIPNQDTVSSISAYITADSKVNSQVNGIIFYLNSSSLWVEQLTTDYYTIKQSDLGKWITLSFKPAYNGVSEILAANTKYLAAIRFYWQTVTPTSAGVFVGSDQNVPMTMKELNSVAKFVRGTTSYYISELPKVRMNVTSSCYLVESHIITNASSATASDGAVNITVSGGTLPYTYNWSNSSSTGNLVNITAGSYILTVTDSIGCRLISTFNVAVQNGVEDIDFDKINIYPVPSKGKLYITNAENASLFFYNVTGELVLYVEKPANTIDISNLAEGIYYLRIQTRDTLSTLPTGQAGGRQETIFKKIEIIK